MAESKAVRISREYREQLVRNEDAALKRMSSYWAKMERETRDNMLLLAQEVTELKKAGQPVPVQYIYTMQRHMKMMEQLVELVPQYEYKALEEIEKTQRKNYTLGLESANAIIQASDPSDDMWTRISQDAAEAMAGYAGNGAPLAELLQTDYGAMASRITDALVSGIGLGKGYKQVAQDMMDAAAIDFRRSVLIARTETNRAYRQANADQYRKSGVVEKVLRLCAMSNSCAACIIMDGWECKTGICEDHPNGKCTTVVVTTGGIMPEWEHGADWLERQDEATQREILGEGRYDLWKNYNIPLDQLVTMKENPVWGGSPAMVSIADLKAKYNIVPTKTISIAPPAPPVPAPAGSSARDTAIQTIKNAQWYKSAIGISKAPDELTRAIDGMSEVQAKVFANGLKQIKKTDFNYSGTPHVSPWENGVYVGLNKPAGKDKVVGNKTAIRTTFHELSHAIDLFNADTVHTISGLRDKIEENALTWANKLLSDAGVPVLKNFNRISSEQRWTIVKELLSDSDQYHSVSDMFEALTNDRISGSYGHGKAYWKSGPNRLEKEFTAHSGQAWITGSRFTEVFGDAVKMVIDEMTRLYGQ